MKVFNYFIKHPNIKKFIFFSSVKAAADQVNGEALTEDMPMTPKGPYGESKAEAEKKAAQLEGVELVIATKVSATGVTYGSVNAATVVEELAKRGIEIDRKIVTMRDMKKVGTSEATVHFHKEVEVKIPVTVVAENQPAPAVEEAPVEQPAEAPVAEEETPAAE